MRKVLIILFLFFACEAHAAMNTIVQQPTYASYSSTTTVTSTYGSACTSGTTLVAVITGNIGATFTVSDPTNGTWTIDGDGVDTNGSGRVTIASIHNTATTALTVTGTASSAVSGILQIYEISGPPSSSYVDTFLVTTGTVNASTAITAGDNVTIIAGMSTYPAGAAADSTYTGDVLNVGAFIKYNSVESLADAGAAGTKTVSFGGYMANSTADLVVVAVAYRSSAGGGGGGGGGSPNVITQAPTRATFSGTTGTKTYGSALTSGSLLVGVCSAELEIATLTLSDPTNGSWTPDVDIQNTNTGIRAHIVIASVHNTSTSSETVTCTASGSTSAAVLQIYEITGPPATSYLDAMATKNGSTAATTNISVGANSTIIAAMSHYPTGTTPDAGYTADVTDVASLLTYNSIESIADAGSIGTKTVSWGSFMADTSTHMAVAVAAYKCNGCASGGGGTSKTKGFFGLD